MKKHNAAGGFILKSSGEILVVKRSLDDSFLPGEWEIPGGGIDEMETLEEGLTRELEEETGLLVGIVRPLSTHTFKVEKSGKLVDITETTFLCRMNNESQGIKLSFEHSHYKWISKEEVVKLDLTEYMRNVINTCFQRLE